MAEENTFKVIVALKFVHETPKGLSCTIVVADKRRETALPLQEGQFFDLVKVPQQVDVYFSVSQLEVANIIVEIPQAVHQHEETEIANPFQLRYRDPETHQQQTIQGSYYVIVLNKKVFIQKNQQQLKKVQFEEIPERRTKTQPQSSQKVIKQSPIVPPKKKTSSKDRVSEAVKQNLNLVAKLDTSCEPVFYSSIHQKSMSELENCRILEKLKAGLDTSQELTPREMVTPTKHKGPKLQVTKTASAQNLSPMIKHDPAVKPSATMKVQNDYLRYAVWNLDQQVSQLQINRRVNEQLRDEFYVKDNGHQTIIDNQRQFDIHISNLSDQIGEALDNEKQLTLDLEAKCLRVEALEKENALAQILIKQKDGELQESNKRMEDYKFLEQRILNLESTVTHLHQLNQKLKDDYSFIQQQSSEERADLEGQVTSLNQKNWTLRQQLAQHESELVKLNIELDQKENQLAMMERASTTPVSCLERQLSSLIEEQQIHLKQIADLKYQNQALVQANDQLKQAQSKTQNRRIDDERLACDGIEQLKRKLIEKDTQLSNLNQTIEQLRLQGHQQKAALNGYQQYEVLYNELANETSKLKRKMQIVVDANDKLNDYLDEAHQVNQACQEEKLQLITKLKEAEGQMTERDSLLTNLKHVVLNSREQGAAYIPFPNDLLDRKVSEFVLDKDDRLKYLLIREQEGIYSFGKRRLFMKIEHDKLLVKTGGGFVRVEQFFDLSTIDAEMERVDRQTDPNKLVKKQKNNQRNVLQSKN